MLNLVSRLVKSCVTGLAKIIREGKNNVNSIPQGSWEGLGKLLRSSRARRLASDAEADKSV